jgi:hypothetical protein
LSVILNYEGQELVSLKTFLEKGKILTNETLLEIPIENQTLETMEFVSSAELNEEEKAMLLDYFGNASIATTKSEVFNHRLIRNYKIGDYEVEYSYEYNGEITLELEEQMKEDLMKWLRDILKEISKNESSSEVIPGFLGNSSLSENSSL